MIFLPRISVIFALFVYCEIQAQNNVPTIVPNGSQFISYPGANGLYGNDIQYTTASATNGAFKLNVFVDTFKVLIPGLLDSIYFYTTPTNAISATVRFQLWRWNANMSALSLVYEKRVVLNNLNIGANGALISSNVSSERFTTTSFDRIGVTFEEGLQTIPYVSKLGLTVACKSMLLNLTMAQTPAFIIDNTVTIINSEFSFAVRITQIQTTTSPSINGVQGATGYTGATGATGINGIQGFTGNIGPTGVYGSTGISGYGGATGHTGNTGSVGSTGQVGPTGYMGPIGDKGPPGLPGPPGSGSSKGDTGSSGYPGIPGPIGFMGAIGPIGPAGATGYGMPGATGIQGATGPPGPPGIPGSGSGGSNSANCYNPDINYVDGKYLYPVCPGKPITPLISPTNKPAKIGDKIILTCYYPYSGGNKPPNYVWTLDNIPLYVRQDDIVESTDGTWKTSRYIFSDDNSTLYIDPVSINDLKRWLNCYVVADGLPFPSAPSQPFVFDINGYKACDYNTCKYYATCVEDPTSNFNYKCECKPGYQRVNSTFCEDINECTSSQESNLLCKPSGQCKNTRGSYYCLCGNGTEGAQCQLKADVSFNPFFSNISKSVGIISGGSNLNLTGNGLGNAIPFELILIAKNEKIKNVSVPIRSTGGNPINTLTFITDPMDRTYIGKTFDMVVSYQRLKNEGPVSQDYQTPFQFTFTDNPEINDINPREIYYVGGINMEVFGLNFLAADSAILTLNISYVNASSKEYGVYYKHMDAEVPCNIQSDVNMTCLLPAFKPFNTANLISIENTVGNVADVWKTYAKDLPFSNNSPWLILQINMGFVFNDYKYYYDLSNSLYNSPIKISLKRPNLYPFNLNPYPYVNTVFNTIKISGENIQSGVTSLDYYIYLDGSIPCEVKGISDNQLACRPPLKMSKPQKSPTCKKDHYAVNVRITKNSNPEINFAIGCLDTGYNAQLNLPLIIGLAIGLGLFALLVLIIVFVYFCCKSKKHDKHAKDMDGTDRTEMTIASEGYNKSISEYD